MNVPTKRQRKLKRFTLSDDQIIAYAKSTYAPNRKFKIKVVGAMITIVALTMLIFI